jgi:AraC-like DNA-binding protein
VHVRAVTDVTGGVSVLLSRTYQPSEGLSPYIRRHYVYEADLPDTSELIDGVFVENSFVLILLRGEWAAEVKPGVWQCPGNVVLCGPSTKPLRIRVRGAFRVVGFAIRPSGWKSMFWESTRSFLDRFVALTDSWGDASQPMFDAVNAAADDEARVAAMELAINRQMDRIGPREPDAQIAEFERIARQNSVMKVDDIADQLGLSVRQFERRSLDTFGLTPKMVLRRSRFFEMAAALRGFSSPSEEQLTALRYSDHSHLNREFKRFAGITPRAFTKVVTPLFSANLKMRAEGVSLI